MNHIKNPTGRAGDVGQRCHVGSEYSEKCRSMLCEAAAFHGVAYPQTGIFIFDHLEKRGTDMSQAHPSVGLPHERNFGIKRHEAGLDIFTRVFLRLQRASAHTIFLPVAEAQQPAQSAQREVAWSVTLTFVGDVSPYALEGGGTDIPEPLATHQVAEKYEVGRRGECAPYTLLDIAAQSLHDIIFMYISVTHA